MELKNILSIVGTFIIIGIIISLTVYAIYKYRDNGGSGGSG
jgi:hypothetical protein